MVLLLIRLNTTNLFLLLMHQRPTWTIYTWKRKSRMTAFCFSHESLSLLFTVRYLYESCTLYLAFNSPNEKSTILLRPNFPEAPHFPSMNSSIQDGSQDTVNKRGIRRNESIALAILDLPIGSVINVDGIAIILQRCDFVGIHSIPATASTTILYNHNSETPTANDSTFHLVTIRGGNVKANASKGAPATSTTTVGFILLKNGMENSVVARRYEPVTEEVSSNPMDEVTINNLIEQVRSSQIEPHRMLSYSDIVSTQNEEFWYDSTNYITESFLRNFRILQHGYKIVPGTYDSGDDKTDLMENHINIAKSSYVVDGIPIIYPPIPVFTKDIHAKNFSSDINVLSAYRHSGTRRFLQALSPTVRTSICFTTNGANSTNIALDYLINTTYQQRWEYLLGDMQLSFVLFLHLHCYTSYTFWRDVITMLSTVDVTGMKKHMKMYCALFDTLSKQVRSIDKDEGVFADIDLSDDDCFLFPSLHQLLSTANILGVNANLDIFATSLIRLQSALKMKFSSNFGEIDVWTPAQNVVVQNTDLIPTESDHEYNHSGVDFNDDDDGDLPVIVSVEEIEESQTRSQMYMDELNQYLQVTNVRTAIDKVDRKLLRQSYPLLLAAMDSSSGKEDILMTCARVLYDAVDVSLVREAAAYLEDIEAQAN